MTGTMSCEPCDTGKFAARSSTLQGNHMDAPPLLHSAHAPVCPSSDLVSCTLRRVLDLSPPRFTHTHTHTHTRARTHEPPPGHQKSTRPAKEPGVLSATRLKCRTIGSRRTRGFRCAICAWHPLELNQLNAHEWGLLLWPLAPIRWRFHARSKP